MQEFLPSSRSNDQEEPSAISRWLDSWAVPSPIAQIDRYLVLIRWEAILAIGIISLFRGFQGAVVPPLAAWPAVVAYNVPVSFYVWRWRPLASGRVGWLLPGDLLQSALTVALTGGYHSFYFIVFLLFTAELALAFPWRVALALTVSSDVLQVGAMAFYRTQHWDPFAAYMIVAKFFILLIVGGLAILFSELMRREDAARQEAARTAARIAALNAIFVRLGESGLNLERTLTAILHSTRTLPDVAFSLVLLPDSAEGSWRIAASNTDRHPVGEEVTDLGEDHMSYPFFSAGTDTPHPLPPFVAEDAITRLTGVYLRSPDGERLGALVMGWHQTDHPLDDDGQAFLQSLALEAGLALYSVRLYSQEREHVARLQRFEALQSTFFSAIGHELKTPLAVLKMLAPSLHQLPELPAGTQAEITEAIEQSLGRLETLITDLLESTRLEAGAVALHPRPVNLVRLTQRVVDGLAPLLSRKNQRATLQLQADLPRVRADSRRVEQVLSNLMGNAAKFAPPQSTIDVQLCPTEDAAQVCVADAGPGVPPEERERIFDKFYTATENKALAGVGLGLFICRELVRLHGGRIWVEDRSGGGCRFCFTLPWARDDTAHEESEQENPGH